MDPSISGLVVINKDEEVRCEKQRQKREEIFY
jgi:hypothetical protein